MADTERDVEGQVLTVRRALIGVEKFRSPAEVALGEMLAEIRRLRSELEEVHARSQRWQSRFHEKLAELERRDAALREARHLLSVAHDYVQGELVEVGLADDIHDWLSRHGRG